MGGKKNIGFAITASILGLMIAIQFRTVSEPVFRDTRDTWELREALLKEKEMQLTLLKEIRLSEEKLAKYKVNKVQSQETALRATIDELKTEAGLTNISGPGLKLVLSPVSEAVGPAGNVYLSPEILRKLVNELNMYGAVHMSIGGERLINTTVIRDINNETKMNGQRLDRFPLEINVIVKSMEDAGKLYNRMKVSNIAEAFFMDNIRVNVHKPSPTTKVTAYGDAIRVKAMKAVKGDGK
ncbi:DUF881 domain-containing protein [Bacillus massilinigeriensis]|uniref:DUF881 domain-containing protein n=1 Tax=Bacillus mediterraneensis TaxID=1805474 RepID=UPI0008F8C2E9|nr:DUF881 domain-containing protein [Bacillus mediterraneensis]